MLFHMKTTLSLDAPLMRRLKALAAERGTTLTALVGDFLRRSLKAATAAAVAPKASARLPVYDMGPPLVDLGDREALEAAMERADRADRGDRVRR